MKLSIILSAIVAAVTFNHVTACLDHDKSYEDFHSPYYGHGSASCYTRPPIPVTVCLNPKQALFQKYPLIFKKYAATCKFFGKKLKGINPCYHHNPISKCVACATPPPVYAAPAILPVPTYSAPACAASYQVPAYSAPVCAAPACSASPCSAPEVLDTLLNYSGAATYPGTSLAPALSFSD